MSNLYPNNIVYHDHAIMMDAVEKSNFSRFLSEILNWTMVLSQFSQIFVTVLEFLDDYFFWFSGKVFLKMAEKEQLIEKNKDVLKELPPPTPSTSTDLLSQWDKDKKFKDMSEDELNDLTHKVLIQMFAFLRTLACALNGGQNHKEFENYILKESIKELEFLLNKKK